MGARPCGGHQTADEAAQEVLPMPFRRFRNPLIWSPVLATLAQLALVAVAAAASGGGDFPIGRR
jgi:hypothetical protein